MSISQNCHVDFVRNLFQLLPYLALFRIYEFCRIYDIMSKPSPDQTCLRVTRDTRNLLAKLGTKDETFEQIVRGLAVDKQNQLSGESQK